MVFIGSSPELVQGCLSQSSPPHSSLSVHR
jgi:hypothetical protein